MPNAIQIFQVVWMKDVPFSMAK